MKHKFKFSWILRDKLAVGTFPRYQEDISILREKKIKSILGLCNPTEASYPENLQQFFNCYRYILPDHKTDDLLQPNDLLKARTILDDLMKKGNVFVHCVASVERSPMVCMSWLMKYKNLSLNEALDYMMSIHKETNPLTSQLKVLTDPLLEN